MENLTYVDFVAIAVILISAVLAYARGLLRETLSIAGWVGAAIVAYIFAPSVEPLMHEIPVLSDIIGGTCELGIFASFGVVFILALIVISLFTPLLTGIVRGSALGSLDSLLGFLFGIARGVLLVAVALIVYEQFFSVGEGIDMVENSMTKQLLGDAQARLAEQIPTETPAWIEERYDQLTSSCQANGETG